MAKFRVKRRRLVAQEAVVTVEVVDGRNPIDVAESVSEANLSWQTTNVSHLSTDVEPVAAP
jgi:hypothetical protein